MAYQTWSDRRDKSTDDSITCAASRDNPNAGKYKYSSLRATTGSTGTRNTDIQAIAKSAISRTLAVGGKPDSTRFCSHIRMKPDATVLHPRSAAAKMATKM